MEWKAGNIFHLKVEPLRFKKIYIYESNNIILYETQIKLYIFHINNDLKLIQLET